MLSKLQSLLSQLAVTHLATDQSPGHMYSIARHQALSSDREIIAALGRFPEPTPDAPAWGVVMDIAYPGFSGTLAAFNNGHTNLHYSRTPPGIPDYDKCKKIGRATAKLIAAANKAIPHLKPTTAKDLPAPWQALFYVRTDSGNLVAEASGEDFRNEQHPLFPLFTAGNELLMEFKRLETSRHQDYLRERIAGLSKALEQNPTAEDCALRGEYYAELGEFDKAQADFEELLTLLPVADAYLGRGCFRMNTGDLTSALADFEHAIEMEPTNAMAYSNRGSVYSRQQDIDKALASYDLAIKTNPDYATAYANRAYAYYKVGRYKDGIADCERAIALRPGLAYSFSNRGLCRAALGDKKGARADFQHALEFDPKAPASVMKESLTGLHALDHPGEPLPPWTILWLEPSGSKT